MAEFSIPTTRYVYFDQDGEITAIANNKQGDVNFIVVNIDDVYNLITGKEVLSNYNVLFDPVVKKHVLRNKFIEEDIQFDINNQIYKIPTSKPKRPDFTIQQDCVNKCWKVKLDSLLEENLKSESLDFSTKLNISITSKNDPHNLHQYFTVDLKTYNDLEIPFVSDLELDVTKISVYTTKRLETYYHEVLE